MTPRFVLKTAIQQEIERDVANILDAARMEGERLLEDARSRRDIMLREAAKKLERDLQIRRQRTLSKTRLEGRNALLEVKRREVDRVFGEVRQILLTLAEEEPKRYGQILTSLFKAGRAVLPDGPLRVRVGKPEAELLRPAVKGKDVEMVVEEGLSGMILETPDGRVRCDNTLDVLLVRIRAEREAEMEKILFGEDHEPGQG